jgi:hypothetical protein
LLALIWFLISPMAGRAAGTQVVRGSVPAATARLAPIGDLDLAKSLHVAISLPIRNQQTLTDLVCDVSNPASPNYRHYLSVAQFTERFGPTQADYGRHRRRFRSPKNVPWNRAALQTPDRKARILRSGCRAVGRSGGAHFAH